MRGQLSLETLFAIGLVMVMFIIVLSFTWVKRGEVLETQEFIEARAECLLLADTLTSVKTLGPVSNVSLHLYYKHIVLNNTIIRTYTNNSQTEVALCNYIGSVGRYINISGDIHVQNIDHNVSIVPG